MLSIVVLFCEKDMWHIPELVRHTKETFKGEYELVLVDNRKDKSAPPPDVGWPIHEASGDGTFEGRRFSLTKCRGKYVWFVDADDITLDWSGFVDLDGQDADFLFFNAAELRDERFGPMYSGDIPTFLMQQGDVLHEDIRLEVNLDSFLHVYLPLWNKFIRLDFARRVYDMVPPLPSVTDHEDSLMSAMLLKHAESVSDWTDKTIYIYDSRTSTSSVGTSQTVAKYKALNKGQQRLLEFAKGHFTEKEWSDLGLDLYFYGDYYWRFRKIQSLPEKVEVLRFITEEFSYENILGMLKFAEQFDEYNRRIIMERCITRYCLKDVKF